MSKLNKLVQYSLKLPVLKRYVTKLEIAITDFCNLDCHLCSQGTPLQQDKKTMSLDEIKRISRFFKPYEFKAVKLSGGEPTLHPQFREICGAIQDLFPSYEYQLASNGFKLEEYLECLGFFYSVEISHYPGQNDETFQRLAALKKPNFLMYTKEDYEEMSDVFAENNLNKTGIYRRVPRPISRRSCSPASILAVSSSGSQSDRALTAKPSVLPSMIIGERTCRKSISNRFAGIAI